VVRELGDHRYPVPTLGEIFRERLHPRLRRPHLGRKILGDEDDPQRPGRARRLEAGQRARQRTRARTDDGACARSRLREQLAVEQVDVAHESRDRIARPRACPPFLPETLSKLGCDGKTCEPLCDSVWIAGRDDEARPAVRHDVAHSSDICRHDGQPGSLGLDDAHRRALVRRRQHDGVGRRVDRSHIAPEPGEVARTADAELTCEIFEPLPERPVADDEQLGVDDCLSQTRKRA
jgi:hypothetical protein